MTLQQTGMWMVSLLLASGQTVDANLKKMAVDKKSPAQLAHLFQSRPPIRVVRKSIYDGPFRHGSPMLTRDENTAAISDCFASFHLPTGSEHFSNAI